MGQSDKSLALPEPGLSPESLQKKSIARLERLQEQLFELRAEAEYHLTRASEAVDALKSQLRGKVEPVEEVNQLEGIALNTEDDIKSLMDALQQFDLALEEIGSGIRQIAAGETSLPLLDGGKNNVDSED